MSRLVLLLSALLVFSVQCRHRIEYADRSAYSEKAGSSLEAKAQWMKYKGAKVDMGLKIHNGYKHVIVLKNHEFHVEMAGEKGYLSSPRAATFELEPDETISREMTFTFAADKPRQGPVKLFIQKIQVGPMEKPGKNLPDVVLELPLHN